MPQMLHFTDPSNPYWNTPDGYVRTRKKKYTIKCSMPLIGTQVTNHLKKAQYQTNEQKRFVLTGTVGEQWVIDANKLAKTYTLEDGRPINPETLQSLVKHTSDGDIILRFNVTTIPNGQTNWAMFIPVKDVFQIPTAWGDVLTVNAPGTPHGAGDFLVCADANGQPNLNDRWVVNGEIFADTYDMRAFPGMKSQHTIVPIDDRYNPREFRGIKPLSIENTLRDEVVEKNKYGEELLKAKKLCYSIANDWSRLTNNGGQPYNISGGIVSEGTEGNYTVGADYHYSLLKAYVKYEHADVLEIQLKVIENGPSHGIHSIELGCRGQRAGINLPSDDIFRNENFYTEFLNELYKRVYGGQIPTQPNTSENQVSRNTKAKNLRSVKNVKKLMEIFSR